MKRKNKLTKLLVVAMAAILFGSISVTTVDAATRTYGIDWSKYQGNNGKFGYQKDKFVISQVGGTYNGSYVNQATYPTQVASAIAAGKYAHTYIWYQVSGNIQVAKSALDYFLPKVQTPKGSIVALDFESGASYSKTANTDALIYGMQRIKTAGYTPLLYSGKYYLQNHADVARIIKSYPNSLWIAGYPLSGVQSTAPMQYFPSMDGVAMWQFTSSYVAGGLDGNVDLLGVTTAGYDGAHKDDSGKVTVKPDTSTPAVDAGQAANNTAKAKIKAGDVVKVNLKATKWANGVGMPTWVRGKTYKVQQIATGKVLLAGILSWAKTTDVEILSVGSSTATNLSAYTVKSGDSWWLIASKHSMNMYTLATINGRTINSMLHPGQILKLSGVQAVVHTYYTVKSGDSFWSIARKYGTNMYSLASKNNRSVKSIIYPGQRLLIR